jgi:hypothetical protein
VRAKDSEKGPWVNRSQLPWQTKQSLNIDGDSNMTKRTTLDGFTVLRKSLSIARPVDEDDFKPPKGS